MSNIGAGFFLVFCSCPDAAQAERMALAALEARLAACVHLLPAGRSYYHWQGGIEQCEESTLLIKTTAQQYPALEALIQALHPYDIPEIIAIPVTAALPAYAQWLRDVLESPDKDTP